MPGMQSQPTNPTAIFLHVASPTRQKVLIPGFSSQARFCSTRACTTVQIKRKQGMKLDEARWLRGGRSREFEGRHRVYAVLVGGMNRQPESCPGIAQREVFASDRQVETIGGLHDMMAPSSTGT